MARRPDHVKPPAYLSRSPPLPDPAVHAGPATHGEAQEKARPVGEKERRLEPTRYGDWEQNGIAVDF